MRSRFSKSILSLEGYDFIEREKIFDNGKWTCMLREKRHVLAAKTPLASTNNTLGNSAGISPATDHDYGAYGRTPRLENTPITNPQHNPFNVRRIKA